MRGLAPAAPARGAAGPSITRRARLAPRAAAAQATVATAVKTIRVESSGAASVLGSVRKQNEDRYDIKVRCSAASQSRGGRGGRKCTRRWGGESWAAALAGQPQFPPPAPPPGARCREK